MAAAGTTAAKATRQWRNGICETCRSVFQRTGGTHKFCAPCKLHRRREQNLRHEHDRKGRRSAKNPNRYGVALSCKGCGKGIIRCGPKHGLCDDCRRLSARRDNRERHRRKAREAGNGYILGETMRCEDCGAEVERRAWFQRRCPDCRAAVEKAYLPNYRRLKREQSGWQPRSPKKRPEPKIGRPMNCADCAEEIIRRAGSHTRCDACQLSFKRRQDSMRQKERRRWADDFAREKLREARRNRTPEQRARRRIRLRAYERERRVRDPKFAIHARMKAMIANALREKKAGRSWQELVGYKCNDLVLHLERQFLKGMSWENRREWEIDHILPVAGFSFNSSEDPEFKACWALSNLRPLWKEANRAKWYSRQFLL